MSECVDASLGSLVGDDSRRSDCRNGGDVHDRAALLFPHDGQHVLAAEEHSLQVDIEDAILARSIGAGDSEQRERRSEPKGVRTSKGRVGGGGEKQTRSRQDSLDALLRLNPTRILLSKCHVS